jgi:hypothetical protein
MNTINLFGRTQAWIVGTKIRKVEYFRQCRGGLLTIGQ